MSTFIIIDWPKGQGVNRIDGLQLETLLIIDISLPERRRLMNAFVLGRALSSGASPVYQV